MSTGQELTGSGGASSAPQAGPTPAIAGLALLGAREALKAVAADVPTGEGDRSLVWLQQRVENVLGEARELCVASTTGAEREGMDERDARAVAFLRDLARRDRSAHEQRAVEVAEEWERVARERWAAYSCQVGLPGLEDAALTWARWSDPTPWRRRLAKGIALVIWHGRHRAEDQPPPPGLIVGVAHGLARLSTPQLTLGLDEGGGSAVLRPDPRNRAEGTRVPVADTPALPTIPVAPMEVISAAQAFRDSLGLPGREDLLQAFGSRHALPLAECVLEISQRRESLLGVRVSAEGAWVEFSTWYRLAQLVLEEENPHPRDVRALRLAAWAWGRTPIRWPDGVASSSLWILDDEPPRAGAPAHGPTFTISERAQRNATWRAREGRGRLGAAEWSMLRIAPLVKPRLVPFMAGSNRRSYGPQTTFVRHLWLHFTLKGRHLLQPPYGVPLSSADVERLAEEAQLPAALVPRVIPHLVATGVIRELSTGYYAPADTETTRFIADGWRNSVRASSAGKASSRSRFKGPKHPRASEPPMKEPGSRGD